MRDLVEELEDEGWNQDDPLRALLWQAANEIKRLRGQSRGLPAGGFDKQKTTY